MQLFVATSLSHLQAFWPSCTTKKNVRNIPFSGGVRKYCCSEQERTKSVPEPIWRSLKSLHIVIENRCQSLMSLMSLMAHQQSNQQHKAISEWKLSHSERLTLDIWFDTYKAPRKHLCKWRNSVHPSEYINDTYVIPEVVGFQKVSLDSHPPRLPGMLHPNLHIRKENFQFPPNSHLWEDPEAKGVTRIGTIRVDRKLTAMSHA